MEETVKEKQVKAQELRLGNWLMDSVTNEPFQVEALKTRMGTLDTTVAPIPLNEEWLLKFGFKWYDDEEANYDWGYILGYFKLSECEFAGSTEKEYHFNDFNGRSFRIEYLHQLQNLYFALTGTELTLKDSPPIKQ